MLDIIKASAGSGKTYQLTYDYIKLLLGEKDKERDEYRLTRRGAASHRSILAVTFTNKATDEMKARILHELAVLAEMVEGWSKKSPYAADLCRELHCTPEALREASAAALRRLLFDFDFFQVSTIDSFFQMVLRTFAREANLTGNYEVALENQEAIEWAVGQYLDSLRTDPDSRRTRDNVEWITDFLLDRMRQGKAVNLFNRASSLYVDLTGFVRHISNETYMLHKKAMTRYFDDADNIRNMRRALRAATEGALKRMAAAAAEALNIIAARSGSRAFQITANAEKMFAKVRDSIRLTGESRPYIGKKDLDSLLKSLTLAGGAADAQKLFKKGNADSQAVELLGALCREISGLVNGMPMYNAMSATSFYLGIIAEVERYIERYRKDTNTLLLSDTNTLLNTIMEGSDTPFVYERIGIWLRHFLIDEFQDTSKMQWENLRPLLSQGTGEGDDSLIIGDEKQCIYRFRNSDPTLLQKSVQKEFAAFIDSEAIDAAQNTNWRSSADVVRFNNALFDPASSEITGAFPDIYRNARQEIAPKNLNRQGYVSVTAVRGDIRDNRDFLFQHCLTNMARNIERELRAGYRPCDIAVLARYKRTASAAIDYLANLFAGSDDPLLNGVRIVSDDALSVGKSPSVRFIVSVLRFYAMPPEPSKSDEGAPADEKPEDETKPAHRRPTRREIAMMVNRFEYNVNSSMAPDDALRDAVESFGTVPDFTESFDPTASYSLQSLVEQIVATMSGQRCREENMFISAFQDIVADYCETNDPDIHSFLQWWDASGSRSLVAAPADEKAIRVMTIHKSKGLEFRCVHVPDASWDFVRFLDLEWFETEGIKGVLPSTLPELYPFLPSNWMINTPLRDQYEKRVREQQLDELNVLYVTLTRAIDELIVSYPAPLKPKSSVTTTGDFLDGARSMLDAAGVGYYEPAVELDDFRADNADNDDEEPDFEIDAITVGRPLEQAADDEKNEHKTLDPDGYMTMPIYYSTTRADLWSQLRVEKPGETPDDAERAQAEAAATTEVLIATEPDPATEVAAVMRRMLATVFNPGQLHKSAMRLVRIGASDADVASRAEERLRHQIAADERIRSWFEGYDHVRPYASYTVEYHDRRRALPGVRIVWQPDGSVDAVLCSDGQRSGAGESFGFPLKAVRRFLEQEGNRRVRCYVWNLVDGSVTRIE